MRRVATTVLVALLAAPHCRAADAPPATLVGKLETLAGAGARDCGTIPFQGGRSAAIACARSAMASATAYHIALQLQGEDGLVWQGAARDEHGKLWEVFFDSDPSDRSAGPTLSVLPCRTIEFEVKGGDVIDCQSSFGRP